MRLATRSSSILLRIVVVLVVLVPTTTILGRRSSSARAPPATASAAAAAAALMFADVPPRSAPRLRRQPGHRRAFFVGDGPRQGCDLGAALFHHGPRTTSLALSAAPAGGKGEAASRGENKNKAKTRNHNYNNDQKQGGGFGKISRKGTPKQQPPSGARGTTSSLTIREEESGSDGARPAAVLDKWGLPPPTLDDVFPPLPDGTELIPVQNHKESTLDQIRDALQTVVPLAALDQQFDDRGVERVVAPVDGQGNPRKAMKLRLLHVSPPVVAIDHFFTPEECEATRHIATSPTADVGVGPPVQVTSKTFEGAVSKRTSTSWFCHYRHHPILLAKAIHVLGLELSHMEEPQLVRYQPGQEFSYHYDQVPAHQLENGGQRLATLLVYLNTVSTSGGTMFRDLQGPDGTPLTVRPAQGSALLFFPADAHGVPDDRTLHCGEPLSDHEEKWIVQMWIHQRSYRASVPPNNRQDDAVESIQETARQLGLLPE